MLFLVEGVGFKESELLLRKVEDTREVERQHRVIDHRQVSLRGFKHQADRTVCAFSNPDKLLDIRLVSLELML